MVNPLFIYISMYLFFYFYNANQTQVTKCDQFVHSTQCNSDGLPSALSCFWLRGNASVPEKESDVCMDKVWRVGEEEESKKKHK
jgi:hypothetical protein